MGKILGILTARGGSKGIPGKNIKQLRGKPLIAYTIETASDAAREFFKGLLYSLKEELSNHQLENYRFAFSVPASFEANQRRDLMKSLKENDIDERQCCFIDEPNAGFLSFIYTCIKNHLSHPLLEKLKPSITFITCSIGVFCLNKAETNLAQFQYSLLKTLFNPPTVFVYPYLSMHEKSYLDPSGKDTLRIFPSSIYDGIGSSSKSFIPVKIS